ncbi:MAG: methyltransferase domain-containing protein [Deltaproteobacteria bacterium]|nr:methyltransferase domain-containing protein [Deltaproteobacteria bacterium]
MKSSGRTAPRKSPPRSRRVPPAEPLAAALLDHYRDGRPRRVTALRADGVEFEIETEEYFTLDGELAPLDRMALERARGRVLDVGAGSGRHALALQAKGCEVVAIDVSPACVELCRERGVRDVRLVDVMTIGSGMRGARTPVRGTWAVRTPTRGTTPGPIATSAASTRSSSGCRRSAWPGV